MRARTKSIRSFLLKHAGTKDYVKTATESLEMSRQSIHKHLRKLVAEGLLEVSKDGKHTPKVLFVERISIPLLNGGPSEDFVWRNNIWPSVKDVLSENAGKIMHYGFQEMFNNVLDHAEAQQAELSVSCTTAAVTITVSDDGVGIFKKLQEYLHLEDQRHAILELVKGKLTSDPSRHTGEGIFFTSRMMDDFIIASGTISFMRIFEDDWLLEDYHTEIKGTHVTLKLWRDCERTTTDIFNRYASGDYGFTSTHVPVRMALYEGETLVSRSQARRILSRVDRFREVVLDFKGVKEIGPAFTDEIFRVFCNSHPKMILTYARASQEIEAMIKRVKSNE